MQIKWDESERRYARERFVKDYRLMDYLLSDYESGKVNGTISLLINVFFLFFTVVMFFTFLTLAFERKHESSFDADLILLAMAMGVAFFGHYYFIVLRKKEAWQKAEQAFPSDLNAFAVGHQRLTGRQASKNFLNFIFGSRGVAHRISNSLVSLSFLLLMSAVGVGTFGYLLSFAGFFFGLDLTGDVKDVVQMLGALWSASVAVNLLVALPTGLIFNWEHRFNSGLFDGQALAHSSDYSDGGGD